MSNTIPIIDIFAGPGGLGEGFSSFQVADNRPFKIKLSIEKNAIAHRTLQLRSFFRQFFPGPVSNQYYKYLRREISRQDLFQECPEEAAAAVRETWCAELGGEDFPHVLIDSRIEKALEGRRDSNWVLIGGPPCQAYSTVGRSRIKNGLVKVNYDDDHRHFLYKEYLRIIAVHKPAVFVMENVKGILSSAVKGEKTFPKILNDLRNPAGSTGRSDSSLEYKIYSVSKPHDSSKPLKDKDFIVHAENYGLPQARHRVILLGIRSDLKFVPGVLTPSPPETMWRTIGDLPKVRSTLSRGKDSPEEWQSVLNAAADAQWLSDGNFNYPGIKEKVTSVARRIRCSLGAGGEYLPVPCKPKFNPAWYLDENLEGVCNHAARGHMKEDLHRYLYAACFAEVFKKSPVILDFHEDLWPKHDNVWSAIYGSMFADRFRVQVKDRPSTTITSHISKDGHYFIHPDPFQCRSLTVREAARLQTFPDNYFFEGNRTEQFHQVGNAVPPLLARQIAGIVYDLFE